MDIDPNDYHVRETSETYDKFLCFSITLSIILFVLFILTDGAYIRNSGTPGAVWKIPPTTMVIH